MKNKSVSLPRVSADTVAKRLTRGNGKDRAYKIADSLAKELNQMTIADVNSEFSTPKELKRSANFWTQVKNILAK